jgi:transketolase
MIFDWVARRDLPLRVRNVGVSPGYHFELGNREHLHEQVGIGTDAVYSAVTRFIGSLAQARD